MDNLKIAKQLVRIARMVMSGENPKWLNDNFSRLDRASEESTGNICTIVYNSKNTAALAEYAKDPNPSIKSAVADNPNCPADILNKLFEDPNSNMEVKLSVLENPNCTKEIWEKVPNDPDKNFREYAASYDSCPTDVLRKMAYNDNSQEVRDMAIETLAEKGLK